MTDDENLSSGEMPEEPEGEGGEEENLPSSSEGRSEHYGRQKAKGQEKDKGIEETTKGQGDKKDKEEEAKKEESKYSKFRRGADIARHPVSYGKGYAKEKSKRLAMQGAKAAARAIGNKALTMLGAATSETWVPIVVGIIVIVFGIIIVIGLILIILWLLQGGTGQSIKNSAGDPTNGPNKAIYAEMKTLVNAGKIVAPTDSPEPDNAEVPSEKEFLLGKKSPKAGYIDIRLLKALVYLGKKHSYLKVSNIIYPYIYMNTSSIETKNTKDNKFLPSISAHKEGKAADVVAIDKVCEKCKCNDVCGKKKIPILVGWQDDPIKDITEEKGIYRKSALGVVEDSFGFGDGALSGEAQDFGAVIENIGQAELERYMNLEPESLDGKNLKEVVDNLGWSDLNDKFALPLDSTGDSLREMLQSAGSSKIEELLNTPTFKGKSLREISERIGKLKLAGELGIPKKALTDPTLLTKYLDIKLSQNQQEDLRKTAQNLDLPENSFLDIINKLKAGQNVSGDFRDLGTVVLSNSFGFEEDIFNKYLSNPDPNGFILNYEQEKQTQFWGKITELEKNNDLPDNSLKTVLNDLARGADPTDNLELIASQMIGERFGFKSDDVYQIARGDITLERVLSIADKNVFDIANMVGISEQQIQNFFSFSATKFKGVSFEVGKVKFAAEFNTPYDVFNDYMSGNLSYASFISQAGVNFTDLAKSWDLPENTLTDIISGNPEKAFKNVAVDYLDKNFNIAPEAVTTAIDLFTSGNFKQAAKQFAKQATFNAIEAAFGLPPGTIGLALMFFENPEMFLRPDKLLQYALQQVQGTVQKALNPILKVFGQNCTTSCHRPKSREKVHKVIKELLEMPSATDASLGLPSRVNMRVTQLITYNYERDVMPFELGTESPSLDSVYGERPFKNIGLFASTQNNYLLNHIHIGY